MLFSSRFLRSGDLLFFQAFSVFIPLGFTINSRLFPLLPPSIFVAAQRAIDATGHQRQPRRPPLSGHVLRQIYEVGKFSPPHHSFGLHITVCEGNDRSCALGPEVLFASVARLFEIEYAHGVIYIEPIGVLDP